MKGQFIPYELALELKELGYSQITIENRNNNILGFYEEKSFIPNRGLRLHANMIEDKMVSAPLWQQAFEWFREKYNLLHIINGIHSIDPFELDCQILNIENGSSYQLNYMGNNYKEAELICLEKLIEIIKQKK